MQPCMTTKAKWIRDLRSHLGLNQADFGALVGVDQSTVVRWEKGSAPKLDSWHSITKLAQHSGYALEVSEAAGMVPVVGFVGAGSAVNLFDHGQGPFDEVERPPNAPAGTVAVEVRGDSMSGIADDRWIIYYDQRDETPCGELLGKLCVVGLADGRALVKKLMPGRQPGRFDLYSSNAAPMLDQEVVWCARVQWIKPR